MLRVLVRAARLGRYLTDGVFVSNTEADVSNQPDGVFVSKGSLESQRVQVIEGRKSGFVELEGSPDMVLEVVSDSSVEKDTVVLRQAYARAGILEYWLVDARKEPLQFDILRLKGQTFSAGRKRKGWARSEVFAHWCRIVSAVGEDGFPDYTLELRKDSPSA